MRSRLGAKAVGGIVEDIAKTLRLALLPFQFGSAFQDRLTDFLNKSIRRVPEANRIPPPAQVLGPVIEAIKFEPDDTPVADMFSELLSKAFDREHVGKAHPSYPLIIRQLSGDEAALLHAIWKRADQGFQRQVRHDLVQIDGAQKFVNAHFEIDEFPRWPLAFADNLSFYIEHLHSLGLAGVYRDKQTPIIVERRQTGSRTFESLRLSPLGIRFMEAVSRPRDS
jgi:hypothetical protein